MFMLNIGGAMTSATVPDVCWTPAAPSPIPMPYPNFAMSDMADPASIVENVLVVAMPALNMGSMLLLSQGDEAGTAGGGVACAEIMGMAEFVDGSPNVMVGGMPGVSLTGMTTQNANNTIGLVVSPSQVIVMLM
ncbi:DUF4150 domain-containing protein [Bordetella tumulicola]|uniref:DUF4150 domain-containing protein n=1 Tax=Bordetella tumulicola TaxID=1649133 RepID=UPI0039F0A97B